MLRNIQNGFNAFVGGFIQGFKDAIAVAYSIWLQYEKAIDEAVAAKKKK